MTTALIAATAFGLGLISGYHIHRYVMPELEQRRVRRELAKWRSAGRQ